MNLTDLLPNSPLEGPPTPRGWHQTWNKVQDKKLMKITTAAGGFAGALIAGVSILTSTALAVPMSIVLVTSLGGTVLGAGVGAGAGGVLLEAKGK